MLQSLGFILIFGTVAAVVVTISITLFLRRSRQVAAALALGAWIGLLVDATLSHAIEQLAVLFTLFVAPLLVTAIGAVTISEFRERLLNVPSRLIAGLNVLRSIGFLFVWLGFAGALGGPFPFLAGYGDVATGLLAIPLALRPPGPGKGDRRLLLWNTFGALDLIVAVALGVLSSNGSPIQLIHAGAGSAAITQLPWALIPIFLVPCFLIGHGVIYAQLLARRHLPAIQVPPEVAAAHLSRTWSG